MTEPMRPWYVAMWVVNVLILIGLFVAGWGPGRWATAAFVLFMIPELIGLRTEEDALPPLTHVVRLWVPRWATYAVTGMAGAWMALVWWQVAVHPLLVEVAIAGVTFWLVEHWHDAYDAFTKVRQGEVIKLWPRSRLEDTV